MTRTITTSEAHNPVSFLTPFKTHGSFRAVSITGNDYLRCSQGHLPEDWVEPFLNDRPIYVVYSYNTPIAWFSPIRGWVMPDRKYSPTTSRHQSTTLRGILPGRVTRTVTGIASLHD